MTSAHSASFLTRLTKPLEFVLRLDGKPGAASMTQVMSTQLRPLTIPRLELQAAVLATRLYRSIAEESQLQFENVTFFSDSNIVLSWIRSEAREFKPFVSARVAEIQSNSDPSQWNTCRESKMWLMKSLGTYQRNDRWQMETGTRILTTVRGVASRSFYC